MFARNRLSKIQPQPYEVQFMLEDSSPVNAQSEMRDLLARINSFCECPETRCLFPAKMRFFGQYALPQDDTPMGYVDLATFEMGEDTKVRVKVWESQWRVWSGEDWRWD